MSFESMPSAHPQAPQPEKDIESGTISQKGLEDLDTVATVLRKRAEDQLSEAVTFYNQQHPEAFVSVDNLAGMSSSKRNEIIIEFIEKGEAEKFADEYDATEATEAGLTGEPAQDLRETLDKVLPNPSDTIH